MTFLTKVNKIKYFYQDMRQELLIQSAVEADSFVDILDKEQSNQFPKGLPNVGNSCFLNSVAQLFYSAKGFRDQLIRQRHQHPSFSVSALLGSLFALMKQGGATSDKKQILSAMLWKLEMTSPSYHLYSQQDAFQALCDLFQVISDQHDPQFLKSYFSYRIATSCPCLPHPLITETFFISSVPEKCADCGCQMTREFKTTPYFAILTGTSKPKKTLSLADVSYSSLASVLYTGSGRSGHYTCIRPEGKNVYLFSDEKVESVQEKQSFLSKIGSCFSGSLYQGEFKIILYKKSLQCSIFNYNEVVIAIFFAVYFMFVQSITEGNFVLRLSKEGSAILEYMLKKQIQ